MDVTELTTSAIHSHIVGAHLIADITRQTLIGDVFAVRIPIEPSPPRPKLIKSLISTNPLNANASAIRISFALIGLLMAD